MSRLKELIDWLCTDGVEYKALGVIGSFIRGNGLQKKDFTDTGFGCIHYGQLYTWYGLHASETLTRCSETVYKKLKKAETGDLVIATTSENVEDVCRAVAWLGEEPVGISGDAYVFKHSLEPKYASYYFNSSMFQAAKQQYVTGTKVLRVSGEDMAKVRIPVPPIEVQREIVRILDSMRELDDALSEELRARNEQMEVARDFLLSSYIEKRCPEGANLRRLGEVAPFVRERANTGDAQFDAYVGVDSLLQNKQGRDMAKTDIPEGRHLYFQPGDTLLGNIRPYLKKVWFADCFGGTNGDVLVFRPCNDINPKYLYYAVSSNEFFAYDNGKAKGSKMPRGDKDAIQEYDVPVPSIEIQREIADILDSMQELSQSIINEKELRRKQYEYYRDRLLDFPEKVA